MHVSVPADEIIFPIKAVRPEKIVEYIKKGLQRINNPSACKTESNKGTSNNETDDPSVPETQFASQIPRNNQLSQKSPAKLAVDNKQVVFVLDMKSFLVEGKKSKKYAMTLYPKEWYPCPSTTRCYHILAAKLTIGDTSVVNTGHRKVNLRMIRITVDTNDLAEKGRGVVTLKLRSYLPLTPWV